MSEAGKTPPCVQTKPGGEMFGRNDSDLYAAFTTYLVQVMGRSPRTAESYCAAVKRGATFLDLPASKVTGDDLVSLLIESTWAQSTKRGVIVAFRQFHLWGHSAGHWKLNGIASLKTPKVPRRKLPPISSYMALKCLAHANSPILYRICYLGLYGGLRVAEQASMDGSMWRSDVLDFIGKGAKPREVPVHPELAKVRPAILSKHPANQHVLESTFWRFVRLHEIRDTKGKYATTHSLRRTAGTTMYRKGTPWEVVAKLLGHGEDVTALYADIDEEMMRKGIWTINYHDGPVQLSLF